MLQLHSASDEEISYLQRFAQKRHKRNHIKTVPSVCEQLRTKITLLEQKISQYETKKSQVLKNLIDLL